MKSREEGREGLRRLVSLFGVDLMTKHVLGRYSCIAFPST